jgi:ABC-2 type transport system permease protein
MNLIKYYHIGKINFFNSFVYVGDMFASSLFVGLIVYVFTQLWQVVYSEGEIIVGFSIAMMLWYFLMTESIVTSLPQIINDIGEEIRSGGIANLLNKPYNYVLYKYAMSIGSAVFKFFLTFIIGAIIVFCVIGTFEYNFLFSPLIFLSVLLAISLHFVIMVFLGLFAFWMEDSMSLYLIYQKMVFVLGGMLLPLEIFPSWLANISRNLPFSYIAYHPAKLFVNFSFETFLFVILNQLIWIILFAGLIYIVFKKGMKKVSINGG